jgi:hypothetical protein
LANRAVTIAICQWSPQPFSQIATVGKLKAESWQNPLILDNQFLHRWMWYSTDWRFKMADFQTEKGSTTIILGLNYCSMGLSQPLFCDPVPLRFLKNNLQLLVCYSNC